MEGKVLIQPEIQPQIKSRRKEYIILSIVVLIMLTVTGIFSISTYVGWNLTHPVREEIITTPQSLGLNYKDVEFTSRGDGINLKGWLIPADGSSKTVIIAHGYRKNRLQADVPALPIVKALNNEGYNALMFDFRNSGESEGNLTSVGQFEVQDLLGAVDYINSQSGINQQIILLGFSMGASTAILAGSREPAVTAVVADAPFADLKTYLNKNLSVWTDLPSFPFNQAFFIVMPALTGIQMEKVSPINEISNMGNRPVLLIHGKADEDIPIENSELLFATAQNVQLLRVPGAQHVKSYATNPDQYISTLVAFLKKL